jgi:predicted dehydrogenase
MGNNLKLGMIGMSEGNGHPYSWSAIFNGYDLEHMESCPFPVIPDYLSKQTFPDDCIDDALVTHIWTQDRDTSEDIAKASRIPNIVSDLEDLIGKVDAVLLARDDADSHLAMGRPFLEAGLPIFIDKPLAYNIADAQKILNLQEYENQIFTCTPLRFAKEFKSDLIDIESLGELKFVDATINKDWLKYGVHIIEPVLTILKERGSIQEVTETNSNGVKIVSVIWKEVTANFKTVGNLQTPIKLRLFGTKGYKELTFQDTFYAFRSSLKYFIDLINNRVKNIPRHETLETIKIIEKGSR